MLTVDELSATVQVSWGLWVANCPRPDCLGAEHYGHAPITNLVGGLTLGGFRCSRCGLACRSDWPGNAEDIWFVLAQRPCAETRNWLPGETLEDLIIENAAHGILPPGIERGPMRILDGRLTDRSLPAAGSSFAIGA